MTRLRDRSCTPCRGGVEPLAADAVREQLGAIHGWELSEDARELQREFSFRNYYETMAFVNAMAWIAHREDHHPDIEVGYRRCRVRFSTHAIGGLSDNDLICAAKVNALVGE
jgi:4a-hydroxytetrahydrobiopterin dehydratase